MADEKDFHCCSWYRGDEKLKVDEANLLQLLAHDTKKMTLLEG